MSDAKLVYGLWLWRANLWSVDYLCPYGIVLVTNGQTALKTKEGLRLCSWLHGYRRGRLACDDCC